MLSPELLLVGWLKDTFGCRTSVELPSNYNDVLPVIVVDLTSGAQRNFKLAAPIVSIDVYAPDRTTAISLSDEIRRGVIDDLPNLVTEYGTVTDSSCLVLPRWLPFDDVSVRRYSATYYLTTH